MVTGIGKPAVMQQVEKKDDNRRNNKPIMEKRRRARINKCLNELKTLILDATKKDPASHSKLEKADILEMTVKHLCGLRSGSFPDQFRAGYRHCLAEVVRFPGLEAELKKRLVKHLERSMPGVRPPVVLTPPPDGDGEETITAVPQSILISAGPGSGVHLVPTRLCNGHIALLLPAGVNANHLGAAFEAVPTLVPLSRDPESCLSPASSSWSSPPPADLAPLALVTKKVPVDKPWRPW